MQIYLPIAEMTVDPLIILALGAGVGLLSGLLGIGGGFLMARLLLRMRFPRSRLYISAFVPLGIGFVGGLMVAIMGIGGGFALVPAMIYILGMPVGLVAGTSLFQIIFTTGITTFLQAITTH